MREIDIIPDWLVTGLVTEQGEQEKDQPELMQESSTSLWQKREMDGRAVIVRSASKSVPIRRIYK